MSDDLMQQAIEEFERRGEVIKKYYKNMAVSAFKRQSWLVVRFTIGDGGENILGREIVISKKEVQHHGKQLVARHVQDVLGSFERELMRMSERESEG